MLSAKPVKNVTLKVYKGHSHGMAHPSDVINADLVAFNRKLDRARRMKGG